MNMQPDPNPSVTNNAQLTVQQLWEKREASTHHHLAAVDHALDPGDKGGLLGGSIASACKGQCVVRYIG